MYQKAYGIIETLAPLHVGASAGEETGNLNLIFRDQFTQTGIIPGSSIRGRFRADMRSSKPNGKQLANLWYGHGTDPDKDEEISVSSGNDEKDKIKKDLTTEGLIKLEYASILWMPVYCPGYPIVRVSCPALLKRYHKIAKNNLKIPSFTPYTYWNSNASDKLPSRVFFNLGFLELGAKEKYLNDYIPQEISNANEYLLLIVKDTEIGIIHDMALYRQSRVSLEPNKKKAKKGAFFDIEALPEQTILTFPIALRENFEGQTIQWQDFIEQGNFLKPKEMYFGGLESIGFGRTEVNLREVLKQNSL